MDNNLIDFKTFIDQKHLKEFCEHLFKLNVQLGIEIEQLRSKNEHLEELLMNINIVDLRNDE